MLEDSQSNLFPTAKRQCGFYSLLSLLLWTRLFYDDSREIELRERVARSLRTIEKRIIFWCPRIYSPLLITSEVSLPSYRGPKAKQRLVVVCVRDTDTQWPTKTNQTQKTKNQRNNKERPLFWHGLFTRAANTTCVLCVCVFVCLSLCWHWTLTLHPIAPNVVCPSLDFDCRKKKKKRVFVCATMQ